MQIDPLFMLILDINQNDYSIKKANTSEIIYTLINAHKQYKQ